MLNPDYSWRKTSKTLIKSKTVTLSSSTEQQLELPGDKYSIASRFPDGKWLIPLANKSQMQIGSQAYYLDYLYFRRKDTYSVPVVRNWSSAKLLVKEQALYMKLEYSLGHFCVISLSFILKDKQAESHYCRNE